MVWMKLEILLLSHNLKSWKNWASVKLSSWNIKINLAFLCKSWWWVKEGVWTVKKKSHCKRLNMQLDSKSNILRTKDKKWLIEFFKLLKIGPQLKRENYLYCFLLWLLMEHSKIILKLMKKQSRLLRVPLFLFSLNAKLLNEWNEWTSSSNGPIINKNDQVSRRRRNGYGNGNGRYGRRHVRWRVLRITNAANATIITVKNEWSSSFWITYEKLPRMIKKSYIIYQHILIFILPIWYFL